MQTFFPEQASTFAASIDQMYLVLTVLSLIFAVPIAGAIVYFGVRYRRGARVNRVGALHGSTRLEFSWIALLTVLSLGVFFWGANLYTRMYAMPKDVLDIYIIGLQWMWQAHYPTGQREINTLHIPVGRPVRLTMVSNDVIHSFYIPAFRTKHDVVAGKYSVMWFEATQPGEFNLFCAEYCGTEHSSMVGKVIALEARQYEEWLRTHANDSGDAIPEQIAAEEPQGEQTLAQQGERLFASLGCTSCHVMNGRGIGPSLVGLFGNPQQMTDGQVIVADAQYIRRSILDPRVQIVAGYQPVMPTYEGQIDEQELLALVEYVRSLNTATDTIQAPDSNPGIETGGDVVPGAGSEDSETQEQLPTREGEGGSEGESNLSGDQPDAADSNPAGESSNPDSNSPGGNLSGDQPDTANENPAGSEK